MLVSAIHQHESAIGVHMSPPSWTSLPPPTPSHPSRLSQSTGFELPESHRKFPLAVCSTYGNVYVSVLLSQRIPPSPSSTVLYVSISFAALQLSSSVTLPFKSFLSCWLLTWVVRVCTNDPTFWISRAWRGTFAFCVSESVRGFQREWRQVYGPEEHYNWQNYLVGLQSLFPLFSDPWTSVKLLWFQTFLVLKLLFSLYTLADFVWGAKKKKQKKPGRESNIMQVVCWNTLNIKTMAPSLG